jgi:hypothetical protein
MIIPLIAEHLNISVKNDDQLIKLASIVQRAMNTSSSDEAAHMILSEAEKQQLFSAVSEIGGTINGPKAE